jgi:hypothetical protein
MTWLLSRFRTGDFVEICSKHEILATLDQHGCVDGMPFMPEMQQYCGGRFRVAAVAHKTCESVYQTWKGRRLQTTVHLDGLRCDGSAHGGCQADCNLFWKDMWLKPAGDKGSCSARPAATMNTRVGTCTEAQLFANTNLPSDAEGEEPRYSCQATELFKATQPLAWWDVRQYVFDVVTRNRSAGRVLRVVFLASLRWLLPRVPFGYRLFKLFHDWMHLRLSGRASPSSNGQVQDGTPTPTGRLNLKPGEYVRIKDQTEIEASINQDGEDQGFNFDPEEMAPYCGLVVRVRKPVGKFIEERTGKMLSMEPPRVTLDGVVCRAEYASCRLNCPRAGLSQWRETWLERVEESGSLVQRVG